MFSVTITEKGGSSNSLQFDQDEVSIGRIQGNDIVLPKSNISKKHAKIVADLGSIVVVDSKSTNGTYINGKRIDQPYALKAGDKIFVGDFTIEVDMEVAEQAPPQPPKPRVPTGPIPPKRRTTGPADDDILSEDEWGSGGVDSGWDDWGDGDGDGDAADDDFASDQKAVDDLVALESDVPEPREKKTRGTRRTTQPPDEVAAAATAAAAAAVAASTTGSHSVSMPGVTPAPALGDEHSVVLRSVHERLLRALDLRRLDVERMDEAELRARTQQSVTEIIDAMEAEGKLPSDLSKDDLLANVLDEALGLGPLEELLADESVTEIMVNEAKQIYVERDGRLEKTDRVFSSNQAVLGIIERIVAPLGRRIDESSPMVDARLKDGSRVNAIIPPLALRGPSLTIRKFSAEPLTVDDLVASGSLTAGMAEFLETCVQARKNVVISGGTGSGKTTTLNVLSANIPSDERIVTIEDAAELKLEQEHVVSLESRPPNIEGKGAITIRDLVRNALRMRPDRIVVGECRGSEALDMLQAMNTGHDGSLTTVHANSPRDALARLETMVLMSGMDLPIRAIRDQICSAINIIVQQVRFPDGSRRLTHISEVTGMETDIISMQDLFVFEQKGFNGEGRVQGAMKATGLVPTFYETLRAMGIEADISIFND